MCREGGSWDWGMAPVKLGNLSAVLNLLQFVRAQVLQISKRRAFILQLACPSGSQRIFMRPYRFVNADNWSDMIQVEKSFAIWILVKPSCCVFTVHVQTLEVCPLGLGWRSWAKRFWGIWTLRGFVLACLFNFHQLCGGRNERTECDMNRVKATQEPCHRLGRAKRHEQKARCLSCWIALSPVFSNSSFEKVR